PAGLVVGRGDPLHERRRLAERHRPEAERAHAQAASPEFSQFHGACVGTSDRGVKPAPDCRRPGVDLGDLKAMQGWTLHTLGGWILAMGALAPIGCSSTSTTPDPAASHPALSVTSTALKEGQPIPAPYACTDYEHLGKSPPLAWASGPEGTVG